MQEKQAGCRPTGEKTQKGTSAEIVFEVQRVHRNPDPPVIFYRATRKDDAKKSLSQMARDGITLRLRLGYGFNLTSFRTGTTIDL